MTAVSSRPCRVPPCSSWPASAALVATATRDNDDSLDLDQLTACEVLTDGRIKLLVAVADVDALVGKGTPIDRHAWTNTTSVYTSAVIFPMLPERLSTDLTSLNPGKDRLAIVSEMIVNDDASITSADVYRARVRN